MRNILSENVIKQIGKHYPDLKYVTENEKNYLKGSVNFRACYNDSEEIFIINPSEKMLIPDSYIDDKYDIEIEILRGFPKLFPLVREVGGRIQQIAEKHSLKDVIDLHINKNQDNAICLCPKPAEKLKYPDKIDLVHFMNNLVVPFLYGLSYYDKFGSWPWNEYSHGDLGIFEFYRENKEKNDLSLAKRCYECLKEKNGQNKKYITNKNMIKGHRPCICGSKEKFRKCHKIALEGIWALRTILNKKN
jgi:hypothetical protein